mmetsp:Transcript_15187/g.31316  ORF Transcript_15187/g.31316 Transcript_15187/m.31316 type:complete len:213 (+) Transcript_15187:59-697(+)
MIKTPFSFPTGTTSAQNFSFLRPNFLHTLDSEFCVSCDCVPVLVGDEFGVKKWRNETNSRAAIIEKVLDVVELDSGGWVEAEHGEGGRDSLHPHVVPCDSGEDLLDGRSELVRAVGLRRGITAGKDDYVVLAGPGDDLGDNDGGDEELCPSINGLLRVFDRHDGTHAELDVVVVGVSDEVGHVVKGVWSGESELSYSETSLNSSIHGLGAGL